MEHELSPSTTLRTDWACHSDTAVDALLPERGHGIQIRAVRGERIRRGPGAAAMNRRGGHRAAERFLFGTLGLKSAFTEIGIGREHFAVMAKKACGGGTLPGFQPLRQADIEAIFTRCL